jgi:hypothetical protein
MSWSKRSTVTAASQHIHRGLSNRAAQTYRLLKLLKELMRLLLPICIVTAHGQHGFQYLLRRKSRLCAIRSHDVHMALVGVASGLIGTRRSICRYASVEAVDQAALRPCRVRSGTTPVFEFGEPRREKYDCQKSKRDSQEAGRGRKECAGGGSHAEWLFKEDEREEEEAEEEEQVVSTSLRNCQVTNSPASLSQQ